MNRRDIDTELKITYTKAALEWCEINLGINERKRRKLKLIISHRKRVTGKFITTRLTHMKDRRREMR